MKRTLVVGTTACAAVAALGIVNAPSASAYAYWRNGYFYGDTSYRGNVPGSHVKVVGRHDTRRKMYYLKIRLIDQKPSDRQKAAVRVRGWDKQARKWVYYKGYYMVFGGYDDVQVNIPTTTIDSIIVQDGIYGKTYGTNSLTVFRR